MQTPLAPWIRAQIRRCGPVPYAQFMKWALYHPEFGYYSGGKVRLGDDRGDYTTSPHLTPVFARCLRRLVSRVDAALGCPPTLWVVEGGPGEGRLASDLLNCLRADDPDVYRRVAYALDELSPALRRRQLELLAEHRDLVSPLPPSEPLEGLYFSNELLDAFPVHRVRKEGGGWKEVYVTVAGDTLVEEPGPLSDSRILQVLEACGVELEDGCVAEVSLEAVRWMEVAARRLRRGYVVTIDYGDEAERLYAPGRGDTCLAYFGHRPTPELLARPGEQDLTAHVNFTALRREGERHGLASGPLLDQREFLFALGLAEEVERLEGGFDSEVDRLAARQALAPLLMGMGEAFKVLVQSRGVPLEALALDLEASNRGS